MDHIEIRAQDSESNTYASLAFQACLGFRVHVELYLATGFFLSVTKQEKECEICYSVNFREAEKSPYVIRAFLVHVTTLTQMAKNHPSR